MTETDLARGTRLNTSQNQGKGTNSDSPRSGLPTGPPRHPTQFTLTSHSLQFPTLTQPRGAPVHPASAQLAELGKRRSLQLSTVQGSPQPVHAPPPGAQAPAKSGASGRSRARKKEQVPPCVASQDMGCRTRTPERCHVAVFGHTAQKPQVRAAPCHPPCPGSSKMGGRGWQG